MKKSDTLTNLRKSNGERHCLSPSFAKNKSLKNPANVGCGPLTVTVTTKIITFLIGNPNLNLHLPLESCEGASVLIECFPGKTKISRYPHFVGHFFAKMIFFSFPEVDCYT